MPDRHGRWDWRDAFVFDHRLQHGFEGDFSSSRAGIAVLELNPAVVEAIQHPNSGGGILHALRSEQLLPCLSRYSVHAHAAAKDFSKGMGHLIRGNAARPPQFDDSAADS